jgi:hypothetical protein
LQIPTNLFLCLYRSDSGSKKQHRIFDLIEFHNFEHEEVVESNFDNEVDALESNGTVVSPEITAANVSAIANELGKAFSKQTEHSEQSDKGVNSNRRTDIFTAKENLMSLVEDVGGECLFLQVKYIYYLFMFGACFVIF